MGEKFDNLIRVAETAVKSGKAIYIYGCGDVAETVFKLLTAENIAVAGLIDDGEGKKNANFTDIPTITSDSLKSDENLLIIIASLNFGNIIYERLIKKGISEANLSVLYRNPKTSQKKIHNIMFVGDNTDTPNFGCQATSTALREILSNSFTIADTLYRKAIITRFESIQYSACDLFSFIEDSRIYCSEVFDDLTRRIDSVEAVVINGEGTFIFENNPDRPYARRDLMVFGLIMHICIYLNKPFYVVNSIFCPWEPENPKLISQVVKLLAFAQKVLVRDKQSLSEISIYNINAEYCPDALFSWHTEVNTEIRNQRSDVRIGANCVRPLPLRGERYVLITGNSEAAHYQDHAAEVYTKLCEKVLAALCDTDIKLVLIECCKRDVFLRNAAEKFNLQIITYDTDIKISTEIICGARVFITGRYHPAVAASLTGVNCIFMGSNSHKTVSLQDVLGIPKAEQFTYSALPDEDEIDVLVSDMKKLLTKPNNKSIEATAEINSKKALKMCELMLGNTYGN
ncbi:MAG: polysaccharide pyruvyl transferase family protein [Ruminococcus sp.]|nr:polysaccharide pyruvyl transferase family protein [Ruminococcus sp.]